MNRKMAEERREPLPKKPVVPLEYAGLWIAWDRDHARIVASGQTIEAGFKAAIMPGESEPILGRAPDAEVYFVGGRVAGSGDSQGFRGRELSR